MQQSQTRKPCVIGNWKMQGSKAMIANLISALSTGLSKNAAYNKVDIVLCPPVIYCETVQIALQKNALEGCIAVGAQNTYCESKGAYTGEISPSMLVDMGCQYVIIGHSERRQLFFEEDTLIARKCVAAYDAGLIPVLCVGETEAERANGTTFEVLTRQLQAVLEKMPIGAFSKVIIAYEPVWAIGTGLTATPAQAEEVHAFLRDCLRKHDAEIARKARILYGGSVKGENAQGLFGMSNIDGALVGGASLVAEDFLKICESA